MIFIFLQTILYLWVTEDHVFRLVITVVMAPGAAILFLTTFFDGRAGRN
jgi:hypothetical protein